MKRKTIEEMKAAGCAVQTETTLLRKGVCPVCRTLVGKEALYLVRDKKMCADCGQAEIERWNHLVREEK